MPRNRPRRPKTAANLPATPPAPSVVAPAASPPASLADELRTLVADLLFLSESEAPFTVIELPKDAVLPDALRTLANLPPDAPAEEWTVADVLTPFTTPDQPDFTRYQVLLAFLESKLPRAGAYKLGLVKKPVFLIGRQPDKSWLGVQTEAVET